MPPGLIHPPPGPRRADDRRVAVASIVIAAAYVAAAILAAVGAALPGGAAAPVPPWLPLHLALAGGASTAIAGVMPFFVAALSAGHPAPARLRAAAVALVALGAGMVALRGIVPAWTAAPVAGGLTYLAGIGLVALALQASGRAGLMVRRPIVTHAYTLALLNVAIGAVLGILMVAGWPPVLERYGQVRPAHAWTNLLGFVSLVIVGTLLHFLPTVVGTRIVPRASAAVAVLGLAMGSPLVVLGLLLPSGPVTGAGAVLTLIGVLAMAVEAARTWRSRGRWTTDAGWHRMTGVGLLAGVAWFVVGAGMASLRLATAGASRGAADDAWILEVDGAPLVLGWVVQVLIASWTHLLPAIGPGGPVLHAARRAVLGRWATPRLATFNAGVALIALGWPDLGWTEEAWLVAGVGLALVAGSVLVGVALAVVALRIREGP
jgi:nitrite reductase (NO-forming)